MRVLKHSTVLIKITAINKIRKGELGKCVYEICAKTKPLTNLSHQVVNLCVCGQFLSAPEDRHKKRPKHVEYYCSY